VIIKSSMIASLRRNKGMTSIMLWLNFKMLIRIIIVHALYPVFAVVRVVKN